MCHEETAMSETETTETHAFQAEVNQVLSLVINSLYSNKEIFVRELVSNASDAIDKLKYQALTDKELVQGDGPLEIRLIPDEAAGTLLIEDDGIGMSRDELIAHLGTVAHSGTKAFIKALEEGANGPQLIGQFGVGFYSSFLVADTVEVVSRAAGSDEAWRWTSGGKDGFTLERTDREGQGTSVLLHFKEDAKEFLGEWRLRSLVTRYADFVSHPICMQLAITEPPAEEGGEPTMSLEMTKVNEGRAMWQRSKSDLTDEDYAAFYQHLTHDWEPALGRTHFTVEGVQLFTGLLYVPKRPPFDLFSPDQTHGIRLYVKRVFIMDDCQELLPRWLRFVRGIVDSDDLPLNVSRELLQDSSAARAIRKQVTKKALDLLESMAADQQEDFTTVWENYGVVLKEGFHLAPEHAERLGKLVRFKTSDDAHEWTSLADYVARMPEGQESIYYVIGESELALAASPHLEALREKGFEILYMVDAIDEWAVNGLKEFDGKPLVSAMQADLDLGSDDSEGDDDEAKDEESRPHLEGLMKRMEVILSEHVKEVRVSKRLTASPSCLVIADGGMHAHVERMVRRHTGGGEIPKRIFEVNPGHGIIDTMATLHAADPESPRVRTWIEVLYGQALVAEGSPIADPAQFASHITSLLQDAADKV